MRLFVWLMIASAPLAFGEDLTCVPSPSRFVGRAAAHSLLQLANLGDGSDHCALAPDDRATYEAFRPGPSESVGDQSESLRFDRPRFKAGGVRTPASCGDQDAVLACAARYGDAMNTLENAVAYAAIKDPAVLGMARQLAQRLMWIVKARATRDVIGTVDRVPSKAEQKDIERRVNEKLARAYGGCTVDQAGCLSGACAGGDQRCAEKQARNLRAAVVEGNLRESMFFLYLSNAVLTENASRPTAKGENLAQVSRENAEQIERTNAFLRANGQEWQLTDLPTGYASPFVLPRLGIGADNTQMRDWRIGPDGKTGCADETRSIGQNPVPSLAMIPLSSRETDSLTKRLGVDAKNLGAHRSPFHSGESCFKLKREIEDPRFTKYNDLLKNTRESRVPMLTGISGTTDSLMTLGRTLGLRSRGEFELLRAAALGWLVSSRDHSVHEIMTASSSFKEFAPYKFKPDSYKTMLPSRPNFARDVEAYQRAHRQPLPADLLDTCLTTREASR